MDGDQTKHPQVAPAEHAGAQNPVGREDMRERGHEAYFHLAGALGMYGTLARRWTEDYPAVIRPGSW